MSLNITSWRPLRTETRSGHCNPKSKQCVDKRFVYISPYWRHFWHGKPLCGYEVWQKMAPVASSPLHNACAHRIKGRCSSEGTKEHGQAVKESRARFNTTTWDLGCHTPCTPIHEILAPTSPQARTHIQVPRGSAICFEIRAGLANLEQTFPRKAGYHVRIPLG